MVVAVATMRENEEGSSICSGSGKKATDAVIRVLGGGLESDASWSVLIGFL